MKARIKDVLFVLVTRIKFTLMAVALAFALSAAAVAVFAPSAEAQSSSVVAEAESWLGVPYVYGGASRSGVDCSGLTQQVFAAFGVSLPRTAAEQSAYGTPVSSPSAGDLVFSDYTGGGIGHVGIATGDGQVINAPYPGTTVRYDPISSANVVSYQSIL